MYIAKNERMKIIFYKMSKEIKEENQKKTEESNSQRWKQDISEKKW